MKKMIDEAGLAGLLEEASSRGQRAARRLHVPKLEEAEASAEAVQAALAAYRESQKSPRRRLLRVAEKAAVGYLRALRRHLEREIPTDIRKLAQYYAA